MNSFNDPNSKQLEDEEARFYGVEDLELQQRKAEYEADQVDFYRDEERGKGYE